MTEVIGILLAPVAIMLVLILVTERVAIIFGTIAAAIWEFIQQ